MKKSLILLIALFVTLASVTPAHAANLVKNGNFEEGIYNPTYPSYGNASEFPVMEWNFTGGFGLNDESGPFWDAAKTYEVSGKYVAFAQHAQIISQDIDGFVQGKQYTLRFLERKRNPNYGILLVVRLGGEEIVAEHDVPGAPFTMVTKEFTASADGWLTLEFEFTEPDNDDVTLLLDAVSIVPKGEDNPFTLNPKPEGVKNPGWPLNAVKLSTGQKISVDGKVTADEYKGAQSLVINSKTLQGIADPYFPALNHDGKVSAPAQLTGTSVDDYTGTYYFMWDDQYFYAGLSVKDDSYAWNGPDPNGSDCLQFVFAETPGISNTANMYIPTIAPKDADGVINAKNDFGGWITEDIMAKSTFAGTVNDDQSWAVEIKIPWSSMTQFTKPIFPPKAGDVVGFTVLSIDYDTNADGVVSNEWFGSNHSAFPWEGTGTEKLYFILPNSDVSEWTLF